MPRRKYQKAVERSTWLSIVANSLLFIFKLWAGIASGSVTLIADAWHTLSDSISSVVILIASKLSQKPPDDEHPYGHGRAETIASVIVGSLLAFVAFHFLVESINRLISSNSATYGSLALWVTVVSILVKELLAQIAIRVGKKAPSRALVADGWHHRSDALSSIIVLIGIFLNQYYWWIDGIMGIGISLFIAYVAYEILSRSISALMGESYDRETLEKVKRICNKTAQIDVFAHQLQIHEYGDHKEIVFHVRLPSDWTLDRVHKLVDDLEQAIEEKLVGTVNVHVDPLEE